jgi:hypothetical protein
VATLKKMAAARAVSVPMVFETEPQRGRDRAFMNRGGWEMLAFSHAGRPANAGQSMEPWNQGKPSGILDGRTVGGGTTKDFRQPEGERDFGDGGEVGFFRLLPRRRGIAFDFLEVLDDSGFRDLPEIVFGGGREPLSHVEPEALRQTVGMGEAALPGAGLPWPAWR